ncbi:hypothetical protein N9383_03580 [Granulosicoccus sp.]|nr:hypothetical protein [Granulosicoccus sp.]
MLVRSSTIKTSSKTKKKQSYASVAVFEDNNENPWKIINPAESLPKTRRVCKNSVADRGHVPLSQGSKNQWNVKEVEYES